MMGCKKQDMMSQKPLFSIVTVSYNTAGFLRDTIDSVAAQTCKDYEHIIIDDNSTDGTWALIAGINSDRVRVIRNSKNLGEYKNRNKGIELANGRYIIFIDGDDIIYPHALATYAWYTERFPDCAMYISRAWDPRILSPYLVKPYDIYRFEFLDMGILGGNFTHVLFHADILKTHGLPENVVTGDTYVQLAIGKDHPALIVPGGLAWWRRRSGNATSRFFSQDGYLAELTSYRLAFVNSFDGFSFEEKKMARQNIYGNVTRQLIRMLLKGKLGAVVKILKRSGLPISAWACLFKPSSYDAFRRVRGDEPLTTRYASNLNA